MLSFVEREGDLGTNVATVFGMTQVNLLARSWSVHQCLRLGEQPIFNTKADGIENGPFLSLGHEHLNFSRDYVLKYIYLSL